jgi:hypothetical protein
VTFGEPVNKVLQLPSFRVAKHLQPICNSIMSVYSVSGFGYN